VHGPANRQRVKQPPRVRTSGCPPAMTLEQAEAFVQTVAEATGRLPVVYVHPTWANGDPLPVSGLSFGARITPDSILARCGLWVADYD